MRKRAKVSVSLCIAALAVTAAALTGPPKGTVEWHKREYVRARNGSQVVGVFQEVRKTITGRSASQPLDIERIRTHLTALVKLGYLEERMFCVSNRPPEDVIDTLLHTLSIPNELSDFGGMSDIGTNSITVIGLRENMFKWEKLIREADLPESGK